MNKGKTLVIVFAIIFFVTIIFTGCNMKEDKIKMIRSVETQIGIRISFLCSKIFAFKTYMIINSFYIKTAARLISLTNSLTFS